MGSEFHLRVPTRARAQFTPDPRDEKPGYCSDSNRWSRVAPSVR
ncbi:hypothetical protein B224_5011 [Aeromonas media WS]|nr:hypothetical protein B224_5011 [Aeromonas media WS]